MPDPDRVRSCSRVVLVALICAGALAGCSASGPTSQAAGGHTGSRSGHAQPCDQWSGATWSGRAGAGQADRGCDVVDPADTESATVARARHVARDAGKARRARNEAAKLAMAKRPMTQLPAIQARVHAAISADRHGSGGFSTGLDIPAGTRSGWVILTVPTENVSAAQRSLAERLQREFGSEVVVWRGGSGPSWLAGETVEPKPLP